MVNDPDDWARDLQLLVDLTLHNGVLPHHHHSNTGNHASSNDRDAAPADRTGAHAPMPVIFSAADLFWSNNYPFRRLGQGAFLTAFTSLLQHSPPLASPTGTPTRGPDPPLAILGKPQPAQYRFVERLLAEQRERIAPGLPRAPPAPPAPPSVPGQGGRSGVTRGQGVASLEAALVEAGYIGENPAGEPRAPRWGGGPIFMVGDNPMVDIEGARRAGRPWVGVLVRTGVYRDGDDTRGADVVVDDVDQAVDAALHRARSVRWHAMR